MPSEKIPCKVMEITTDEESVVMMHSNGYEIPRVAFPTHILLSLGLKVGDGFYWTPDYDRDKREVQVEDIDLNDEYWRVEMTAEEKARLNQLFEESQTWDRTLWPEYTGPGE